MQFEIPNPKLDGNNRTALSQPAYAGDTTLNLYNTAGMNVNDYYVLDVPGNDKAELVSIISVVSSTQVTCSTVTLGHAQGASFVFTPVNQIQIYRSTTGLTGTFTLLSTINISWDQNSTAYFDSTGQSTYAYYNTLYNLNKALVVSQSSSVLGSGYDPNSYYFIKQRVRTLLKDYNADFVSEDEVGVWINEKYNKMHLTAVLLDQAYDFKTAPAVSVNISTQEYPLPIDFLDVEYLRVSTDGGVNYFPAIIKPPREVFDMQFSVNNNFNASPLVTPEGDPYVYAYIKNQNVGFWPLFTGNFILAYSPLAPILVNDTDIPYSPLSNFTYMMVNYSVMRGYEKSGRADLMTRVPFFKKEDEEDETKLKAYLQYRQNQYPEKIRALDNRFVSPIDTDMEDSNYL